MKWVFVLLTLAFAIGFVVYGVGSGTGGSSVGDVLRDLVGQGSSGQSVSAAQKKVDEHPNDPAALLALATALQTAGKGKEAIDVLLKYAKLKPGDTDALRQLAALYEVQAGNARRRSQELLAQSPAGALASVAFTFPGTSGLIGAIGTDPVDQAISHDLQAQSNAARDEAVKYSADEIPVYEQLLQATPSETILYIQLAQVAEAAGDSQKAIDAYKKYLELAGPDDGNAPFVKDRLRLLGVTPDQLTG
jgi:tetratricopeptide (TPR) repeat protein